MVTGAAGFIGTQLVKDLVAIGRPVVAVDCFLPDSYSSQIKRGNAEILAELDGVRFVEADVRRTLAADHWRGVEAIVNLAAMPGLTKSWEDFELYSSTNFEAVNQLVHQSLEHSIKHFVQISTSSVYGTSARGSESIGLNPSSPYGVTKLAGERLVSAYGQSLGLPFTILRYFSVYGPGQRPDMAYHKFIDAILNGRELVIFGDGRQSRSNTFLTDITEATCLVLEREASNSALNVAGSESYDLLEVIGLIAELTGLDPNLRFEAARNGDQRVTLGDTSRFREIYGWKPRVSLRDGLAEQIAWHIKQLGQRP